MLDTEIELATELARKAGAILLDVYGSKFTVEMKSGKDPVTEADKRANAFLVAGLRDALGDDGSGLDDLKKELLKRVHGPAKKA